MNMKTNRDLEVDMYRRAIGLLSKCEPWIADATMAQDNGDAWTIYYAVDADVISLYLNPDENTGYGEVFESDRETAAVLSRLLSDFIFLSHPSPVLAHSKTNALLLFSPHQEELYRILVAVAKRIQNAANISQSDFRQLSRIFENYGKHEDDAQLLQELEKNAPQLVMLYDADRGAKLAVSRFAKLSADRLINIERFQVDGFTFPLPRESEPAERAQLADRVVRWRNSLREHKRFSSKPVHAILRDAEVLATLEILNARLFEERKRVVLVTGAPYLFAAAGEMTPRDANPKGLSFANLYLRHPQCFLAHSDFFRYEQAAVSGNTPPAQSESLAPASFRLVEWLGILFPELVRERIRNRLVLNGPLLRRYQDFSGRSFAEIQGELIAEFTEQVGGKALLEISSEWSSQVRKAALGRYGSALDHPDANAAAGLARVIRDMMAHKQWSFKDFENRLSAAVADSLSKMYSHAVWLGLWTNRGKVVLEHSKGLPRLRFDPAYQEVHEYCKTVMTLQLRSEALSADEIQSLKLAHASLHRIDPTFYHSHIVHALAFATKGRWDAALTLCKVALSIADRVQGNHPGDFIRGREAAYLAAIASRRSAYRITHLDRADEYLDEAESRENPGADIDLRFRSERLAIAARRIYYHFYFDQEFTLKRDIEAVMTGIHGVVRDVLDPKNEDIRNWVLRQSYINYLNLALIARGCGDARFPPEASLYWMAMKQLIENDTDIRDPHANLILDITGMLMQKFPADKIGQIRDRVLAALSEMQAIVPYDTLRANFFRTLI